MTTDPILPSPTAQQEPPTLSVAELDRDPHGVFRHYRPLTPLLRREDGSYLVIRAKDVERLTADPQMRKGGAEFAEVRGITSGPIFDAFKNTMLMSNGEEHRKRRAPMARTFAFRMIAELRPRIRALAEELIETHKSRGEMNLLDEYAALLPARTISDILGVPEADIPRFTTWVYKTTRALSFSFTPEELPEITDAGGKLSEYVNELLKDRRAMPGDDFLSRYATAADEAGELSPEEILSQVITLIAGGTDTTRGAMAMQVSLLLQHREQWDAVCRDASLIPGAVSEAMRYEPSVGGFGRLALEDLKIDGYKVPAKRFITLSTISAMRDPELYAEPDRFNIKRTDHPRWHMVFGGGAHRCLGEALARAELEEGLAALAARIPHLQLAGEPSRLLEHSGVRPITAMRVAWTKNLH